MKRFLTLLLCLTLLVSMAALPATSLAEETVELTFYYPVGVGGDLALLARHSLSDGVLVYATGSRPGEAAGSVACERVDRRARRRGRRKGAEKNASRP